MIWSVAFSADSKTVAWTGMDSRIIGADAGTGQPRFRFPGYPGGARSDGLTGLAFSPDGKALAAVGSSAAVHVWDLTTGRELVDRPEAHRGAITGLVYSADGRTLASASDDHTVRLWETATGRQRRAFQGPASAVRALTLSLDGKTLAGATHEGALHLWETATAKELRTIQAVERTAGVYFGICPVAFTADGKALVSWGG